MLKKKLNSLPYFFKVALLFCLSFYICALIFPLIKLKYSNPHNFIGVLSQKQFHPLNNLLRYGFFILVTPSLFLLLKKFLDAKKYLRLRAIFILALVFSFFLSLATIYLQKYTNIDMFHDSEQLGVGSAIYFFNKKPFLDLFFVHGVFSDPLIASISFKLLGPAIGSFYLLSSVLNLMTFALFFFLLLVLIKDEFIFYAASLFFYGSLFLMTFSRDLVAYLYLLIVVLILKKKIKETAGFFLLSFLAGAGFYYSIDKSFYLSVATVIFWVIFSLLQTGSFSQYKKISQIVRQLGKNSVTLLMSILGFAAAGLVGLLSLGKAGYLSFVKDTFFHIPQIKPFLDEYIYPSFSPSTLFLHWFPIILISIYLSFIFYRLIYQKKEVTSTFIFPLFFTLLGILFFRSALGRSDNWHILYVVHYVFLGGFVIFDYLIAQNKNVWQKYLVYIAILLIFCTPFFDFKRLFILPKTELTDIKIFFSMPKLEDNYWLNYEERSVKDYILANTTRKDKIFVFTNAAAYYYLTQRDSPTKYYTIWFAVGDQYQQKVIADLEKNPPKYILYQDKNWWSKIDKIQNSEKLPLINKWILENYRWEKTIGSQEIYRQKTVIIK